MFEFQLFQYGQVSMELTTLVPDDQVRVAVYDEGGVLLYEELGVSGSYAWEDPEGAIHHVVVEAATGALLTDDVLYGPYQEAGGEDSGDSGDSSPPEDTGEPPQEDSCEPPEAGDSDETGLDVESTDASSCGCGGSGKGALAWLLLPLLLAGIRLGRSE